MPIVVAKDEDSCVHRAAACLAADIQRITDITPDILEARPANKPCILLSTAPAGSDPRWEAYSVDVSTSGVTIRGSNSRGTAFGVYELCERIGVDPLYIFSGFTPGRMLPLVVRSINYEQGPPTFKYRGFFHDDEDILPRPRLAEGKPDVRGKVPQEWYERFFETALRLRMNMVAPYVRTIRDYNVEKTASDWGLYYTSHHYDTLLSDPYHFERGHLAEKRGVTPVYDWLRNRDGMVKYWRGGVEETRLLHCIWPIGIRGTEDYGYKWPTGYGDREKAAAFNEGLAAQAQLLEQGLPPGSERPMHFTLYSEMLPMYQTGLIKIPEHGIVVWPDDNDGNMRALPAEKQVGTKDTTSPRNGVYYHLAYLGSNLTKQLFPTVPDERVEREFRKIVSSDATEFCLVNVTELREFVLGSRFIADICWNAPAAFEGSDAAARYLNWWCTEYFGERAAKDAARSYNDYFAMYPRPELMGLAAEACTSAGETLRGRIAGTRTKPWNHDPVLKEIESRLPAQESLAALLRQTSKEITPKQSRTFFFENLQLPAAYDRLSGMAAVELLPLLADQHATTQSIQTHATKALIRLDELDMLLRRGERWPFEGWYGPSAFGWKNRRLMEPRMRVIELISEMPELQPEAEKPTKSR